jgi:hypothetical protein
VSHCDCVPCSPSRARSRELGRNQAPVTAQPIHTTSNGRRCDPTSSFGKCISNRTRYSSVRAHGFPAKPTPSSVLGSSAAQRNSTSNKNVQISDNLTDPDHHQTPQSSCWINPQTPASSAESNPPPIDTNVNPKPKQHNGRPHSGDAVVTEGQKLQVCKQFQVLNAANHVLCPNTTRGRTTSTDRRFKHVRTHFTVHVAGTVP